MELSKIKKNAFLKNPKYILLLIIVVASFLRLWRIDVVPVSLFGDELDVGYQAYSVLKTGRDYSGNFMPIHFQSLAEWRTPLYLYSSVPTVALFGISPLGVRLPAAIFGILTIPVFYLLVKRITNSSGTGLLAAFLMSISPWHLEYSRAAFEVTQLLFFLVSGLYLFLYSIKAKGKYLWLSGVCFALMPWVYSTAKLYTPLLLIVMLIIYRKEIIALPKKAIVTACVAIFIVAAPIAYSTFFGGGTARFDYISIFSDPTTEPEIGTARGIDAHARGETGTGLTPTVLDKMFHNKFTLWGDKLLANSLMPFSTDFLFISGDPNPRHSIDGMGELYKVEIVGLLAGLAFFITKNQSKKEKFLIGFMLLGGVVPAALTRDGGNHATRLILLLPALLLLISFGFCSFYSSVKSKRFLYIFTALISLFYLMSFASYEHLYWMHNPTQSERWWHYGWQQAIQSMKDVEGQYDSILISTSDEPPWIFFAAWYQFDPSIWHAGYPFKKHTIPAFGEVSYIGKFSFGSPSNHKGLYDWGKIMDDKILYVASAKEVNVNLIMEPERLPSDLTLVKAIAYPSGEPAFYLFTGKPKVTTK